MVNHLKSKLTILSNSFFHNNFFGLYHGSISAKTDSNRFIINNKEAVFHDLEASELLELGHNKDYRWRKASIDTPIHAAIYSQISDAKFISFTMPPFVTAYSINHSIITPKDYFGQRECSNITIYDPKSFDDWYDRASSEIPQYFIKHEHNIMIIKGYGVYAYSRDLQTMTKKLAVLEKSCRLLMLSEATKNQVMDF
ncbi:class II aldolase and adducin N-terminal domain-containing protein [Sulfurimonas sp. MAG313]|nr:class II aldolase and adducin N-terminal domain-containing protein [Sulfurimonas sp. MAG313]MDF1881036.1 class II aldolase and adducin N-terminal domain-containing protein [Sulfurimonas sp. MAG313]